MSERASTEATQGQDYRRALLVVATPGDDCRRALPVVALRSESAVGYSLHGYWLFPASENSGSPNFSPSVRLPILEANKRPGLVYPGHFWRTCCVLSGGVGRRPRPTIYLPHTHTHALCAPYNARNATTTPPTRRHSVKKKIFEPMLENLW